MLGAVAECSPQQKCVLHSEREDVSAESAFALNQTAANSPLPLTHQRSTCGADETTKPQYSAGRFGSYTPPLRTARLRHAVKRRCQCSLNASCSTRSTSVNRYLRNRWLKRSGARRPCRSRLFIVSQLHCQRFASAFRDSNCSVDSAKDPTQSVDCENTHFTSGRRSVAGECHANPSILRRAAPLRYATLSRFFV